MVLIADAIGLKTEALNKREIAIQVVKELRNIVSDVGIPSTLDKFGVKESDIELLAQNGIKQTRLLNRSPKPFTLEDVRECYKSAYHGILKLGN